MNLAESTSNHTKTDPTFQAAIRRLGRVKMERIELPWHCLDCNRDLSEKQARVFHPDHPIVSRNQEVQTS